MKKYQVIYADPPWSYTNKNTGGSMKSGASSKYPVMGLDDICSLPISGITDDNSVLFLWVTCPMQREGMVVMDAWGYKYKTKLYWRKIMSLGMGFWFRGQVEELWLGVKGKVKPFRLQIPNFKQSKSLRHSQKPEEFRDIIEMTGLMPRIELFACRGVDGWDCLGYDIDGKDIRESIGELSRRVE